MYPFDITGPNFRGGGKYKVRYLMGENLKVVWAEFFTLGLALLVECLLSGTAFTSRVENSAQVLPCVKGINPLVG
jgi:hypothetical protein